MSFSVPVVRTYHVITRLKRHYKTLYISQSKLASILGYSRQTINEIMSFLDENHLLDKEYRHAKTCVYHIPDYMQSPEIQSILRSFFRTFFAFSFLFLAPNVRPDRNPTQLILKSYLYNKLPLASMSQAEHFLVEEHWHYKLGHDKAPPNTKYTFQEFINILNSGSGFKENVSSFKKTKETRMYTFSPEELSTISKYPKATIDYANKALTKRYLANNPPGQPFSWFVGTCEEHLAQTSKPGKQQDKPLMTGRKPAWNPEPDTRKQETDYEYAYSVERELHKRIQEGTLHPGMGRAALPSLHNLTQQEKDSVLAIHTDCTCRTINNTSRQETQKNAILPPIIEPFMETFHDGSPVIEPGFEDLAWE